jgi:hypothetical protein
MSDIRNYMDFWYVSHMTFRHELIKSVPVEAVVEYQLEPTNGFFLPRFDTPAG